MNRGITCPAVLAVLTAAAVLAGTARAAQEAPAAPAQDTAAGRVDVRFAVDRFVARGKRLVAVGAAIATYRAPDGTVTTVRKPFSGTLAVGAKLRALSGSARICDVLFLQLDKLHLELLGLVVDLDKVTLWIKANNRQGVLGSLFCSLANTRVRLLSSKARQLNQALPQTGLRSGVGFAVPLKAATAVQQQQTCQVLDLVLGPLDLNLLGLLVHLNQVHLTITANREGGVLGSLFCALASTQVGTSPVIGGGTGG